MTQNDIAYYNARNEAKDMRLRRRETKRHNVASEATERTKAAASYISAEAAKQNAATNAANYELEFAREYGVAPGEDNSQGWVLDVNTGEKVFVYDSPDRQHAVAKWQKERVDQGHIVIELPSSQYGTPQSYVVSELKIAQGMQDVRTGVSQENKNFWSTIADTSAKLAKTVSILVETGIIADKYVERKSEK